MTGLDKIIQTIQQDSEQEARNILSEADAKAKAIVDKAEQEGAEIRKAEEEKTMRLTSLTIERAKSSCELKKTQMLLKEKQELIRETLQAAEEKLLRLPDDAYFELLMKLFSRSLLGKSGTVYFSEADLKRLPEDFGEKLNQAAAEKGGEIRISREPRRISGGFILEYGGIEENCSFGAIFDTEHENLEDLVQKALFSEE